MSERERIIPIIHFLHNPQDNYAPLVSCVMHQNLPPPAFPAFSVYVYLISVLFFFFFSIKDTAWV